MPAAILDVDGTLVDTNYQHAIAWYRALRDHGYTVQLWEIHRHIGMGGNQLVAALIGEEGEEADGDAIRVAERGDAYGELIGEVQAMDGATELMCASGEDGATVVLASSAKEEEVDHYLDLLDARERVEGWTTSDDVEQTKPEPDLIQVALEKVETRPAVMVGDSTWDVKAAEGAGVPDLAVLTGGFSAEELKDAGAARVLGVDRRALRAAPGDPRSIAASSRP